MPLWTSQVVLLAKNPPVNAGRCKRHGFSPWVGKIPWRRAWQPTSVFLPGESHGQRSLASHSSLGCTELSMTKATQHIAHSRACLCMCIYHTLLIHLSVDRLLGSFHILAIVNYAAVNIGMHIYFLNQCFCFISDMYTQEWNCWVIWQFSSQVFFFFKKTSICLPYLVNCLNVW